MAETKTTRAATHTSAPEHASPIARLQKAARRAKDEGDLKQAEKFTKAARNLNREFGSAEIKDALEQLERAQVPSNRPKRAATQPTAAQLRKAARIAREAGASPLAVKYDKVAADSARYEALSREHGADLSEEGLSETLRKVGAGRPTKGAV